MRLKRLLTATAALAVAVPLLASCGGQTGPRNLLEDIKSGHVVLGTKYDQPGLGLQNPGGEITGFDADVSRYIVKHIADGLGVPEPEIKWKETPSAQREAFIRNGEVDTIAATYSITSSRAEEVSFAGPYFITYQGLMVREDDNSLNTLTDLNSGKRLCSAAGSTPAQNVKAQLPGVQLQQFDSYSSCVEGVRRDKVDALTTDETILAGYANRWEGEFKLVPMTYPADACVKDAWKTAGSPFSTEYYGVGMAKEYPEAVKAVNEALQAMMAVPEGAQRSPWDEALRNNLGDQAVDEWAARAAAPDSGYKFTPTPGDLAFLDSEPTPCPAGGGN